MKLGGGKFTLNPMKKLGEVPLASAAVGAAGAAVGGAAANLYAGIRNGNGVGGTIRSTIGGATGGLFRGAKAGLTGYAQVYGKYNTTPYDKLMMDLMYISNPSIVEDFKIMFATVKILFEAESTEGVDEGKTIA